MSPKQIDEIRQKHRESIPSTHNGAYRAVWDKAIKDRSLRAAVKAKCLDCCNWDKSEIKDCLCPACPLFEVRPYAAHPKRFPGRGKKAKAQPTEATVAVAQL